MTDAATIGRRSRRKGSVFEREVARELWQHLGIGFNRNLEQTRSGGGDLIADDPTFPYLIEVKRRSAGNGCRPEWWAQACRQADQAGLKPALIYRYDRQPIWVQTPLTDGHVLTMNLTLPAFAYVAREMMNGGLMIAGVRA